VTPPVRPYAVIYDGTCAACGQFVRALARWDRHEMLEIIPSQAVGIFARFPWIPARAFTESVQVVRTGDGKTWQGAAALEAIIAAMPRGRWIAWVFRIPFVRPLAEGFYRWFARNRYRLGCGEHCQSRPPDVSEVAE